MQRADVVIVGGGMAGVTAARTLHELSELSVLILEKSRGIGGRMATRSFRDKRFDHGAQFVTVRDGAFQEVVEGAVAESLVHHWWSSADSKGIYAGTRGMTALPRYILAEIPHSLEARVIKLQSVADSWLLETVGGLTFQADTVILTPPPPQCLELLEASQIVENAVLQTLKEIQYESCICVLLDTEINFDTGERGIVFNPAPGIATLCNNRVKGIQGNPGAYTVHYDADLSAELLTETDEVIRADLFSRLQMFTGIAAENIQVHRWRYARPAHTLSSMYMKVSEDLFVAGEAFAGAAVEGAYLSGRAVAATIAGDK